MRHARPTRVVTISPGGSRVATPPAPAEDFEVTWAAAVAEMAAGLGLDGDNDAAFVARVNEAADALALATGIDIEVARTKVRGALLGEVGMVTAVYDVDLSDGRIAEVASYAVDEPNDGDLLLARLAILHDALVEGHDPAAGASPRAGDGAAGEGGGSAALPDAVPQNAADVIAWIDGDPDRARRALDAEHARDGDPRKTVMSTIEQVLAVG